jgi:hypothetical protein
MDVDVAEEELKQRMAADQATFDNMQARKRKKAEDEEGKGREDRERSPRGKEKLDKK